MKKKSASRSAFFNLRVLLGVSVVLAGAFLALVGFGARPGHVIGNVPAGPKKYKVTTKSQYISPLVPPGFDCSKIHELGIDRMENFRAGAIMIFCGEARGGEPEGSDGSAFRSLSAKLLRRWRLVLLTWI